MPGVQLLLLFMKSVAIALIDILLSYLVLSNWLQSLPKDKQAMVHVLSLPLNVREDDVCFRWITPVVEGICLAVDNIIVTDVAKRPSSLHIKFDPLDPTDWIFFPGGFIQVCSIQFSVSRLVNLNIMRFY